MIELTWAVAWWRATTAAARARRATARVAADARRRAMAQAAGGSPHRTGPGPGFGPWAVRAQVARDLGAGIVETVVIIGAFVAAAIVIVAILVAKAKGAADNVKTQ